MIKFLINVLIRLSLSDNKRVITKKKKKKKKFTIYTSHKHIMYDGQIISIVTLTRART